MRRLVKNDGTVSFQYKPSDGIHPFRSSNSSFSLDFARSLSELSLNNLTYLKLQFGYWEPYNHSWQTHSALHSSHLETDYLSMSLNKLTRAHNLRYFYFYHYTPLSLIFSGQLVKSIPTLQPPANPRQSLHKNFLSI
jgi:hypothetical protein